MIIIHMFIKRILVERVVHMIIKPVKVIPHLPVHAVELLLELAARPVEFLSYNQFAPLPPWIRCISYPHPAHRNLFQKICPHRKRFRSSPRAPSFRLSMAVPVWLIRENRITRKSKQQQVLIFRQGIHAYIYGDGARIKNEAPLQSFRSKLQTPLPPKWAI